MAKERNGHPKRKGKDAVAKKGGVQREEKEASENQPSPYGECETKAPVERLRGESGTQEATNVDQGMADAWEDDRRCF